MAAIFLDPTIVLHYLVPKKNTLIEIQEDVAVPDLGKTRIAVFAHVFYKDFADLLMAGLETFPRSTAVFVSTTSIEIADRVSSSLLASGFNSEVRVCPNVGRNFGPLFVEFADKFSDFEFVIHVHSKKSLHADSGLGIEWRDKLVHLLLNYTTISRAVALLKREEASGFVTADVRSLIRSHNWRWGKNLRRIEKSKLSSLIEAEDTSRHYLRMLDFPAGGMFLIKSNLLQQIANAKLSYEDFDVESGQIDGTLSHALERLIGLIATKSGARPIVYRESVDKFFFQILS
jgi:O-antigen biosynthesis protein